MTIDENGSVTFTDEKRVIRHITTYALTSHEPEGTITFVVTQLNVFVLDRREQNKKTFYLSQPRQAVCILKP